MSVQHDGRAGVCGDFFMLNCAGFVPCCQMVVFIFVLLMIMFIFLFTAIRVAAAQEAE